MADDLLSDRDDLPSDRGKDPCFTRKGPGFAALLAVCAIATSILGQACATKRMAQADRLCTTNLYAITDLAWISVEAAYDFPASLGELARGTKTTNTWIFVCPATGHVPGSLTNVDQWTDYIYIGSLFSSMMDSRVPMVISPPENHGGQYGYVAFWGQDIHRISAKDIRALVNNPWRLASKLPAHQLEYLTNQVTVQVPERFRFRYPNAYRAPVTPKSR